MRIRILFLIFFLFFNTNAFSHGPPAFPQQDSFETINVGGGETTHIVNGISVSSVAEIHSEGGTNPAGLTVHNHGDAAANSSELTLFRSRGTHDTPTAVIDGTIIGRISALPYDGTDHNLGGQIYFDIDGTPGTDNSPTTINFATATHGQNSTTTKVQIKPMGDVVLLRSQFIDEMWNGIAPVWATRVTTGSAAVQSRANGWYRLTTGATATNEESLDWNDILTFVNTQRPSFEIRLDLEEISNTEMEAGLMEVSGGDDGDYIRVYFDASAGTSWSLEASTAGTPTADAGADADINEVLIRFEFTSDTALEWFIDGVSQGVVITNVPTAALQPYIEIHTEENGAHYVDVDFVKLWQDRS